MIMTIADGATVVYESSYVVITWNGSATFNVYSRVAGRLFAEDCFTRYGVATGIDAVTVAQDWAWSE